MAEIQVRPQDLVSVADEVKALVGNYNTEIGSLYDAGRALDSMWDGDANDSFNNRMGQDQSYFTGMATVLEQYIQNLNDTASAYVAAESKALNILSTNTIRR